MAMMKIEPVLQERGVLNALLQRYDERIKKFKIGEDLCALDLKMLLPSLASVAMETRWFS